MKTRKPFLAALALAVAVLAGDAVAGKSDEFGRAVITYEESFDGGSRTRPAPLPVSGAVVPTSHDGGLPVTVPKVWTVVSTACIAATVDSASKDAGLLVSADTGGAASGVLYRCVNPSASVGDVCFLAGGTYPTSCTAPQAMVRVPPGGEVYTALTAPVYAVSSSGAAGLTCCPVSW